MASTAPAAEAPMTPEDQGPKEEFTVCIEKYADGSFKVGKEMPEGMEPVMGEGEVPAEATADGGYQDAPDMATAMKMAQDLLGPDAAGDMDKGFQEGFGTPEQNSVFQKGF